MIKYKIKRFKIYERTPIGIHGTLRTGPYREPHRRKKKRRRKKNKKKQSLAKISLLHLSKIPTTTYSHSRDNENSQPSRYTAYRCVVETEHAFFANTPLPRCGIFANTIFFFLFTCIAPGFATFLESRAPVLILIPHLLFCALSKTSDSIRKRCPIASCFLCDAFAPSPGSYWRSAESSKC